MKPILTFAIEEWFHIQLDPKYTDEVVWGNYETRIYRNMDLIYEALDKHNHSATFFCLGWLARKHPEVIKKIDALGYEIGSHSDMHEMAHYQDQKTFKNDFERAIKSLEDLTGKKVRSYRAPAFSITQENKWAFDIMNENGITVDSSIFPGDRDFGGFSSFGSTDPCIIEYNGYEIREFPINYATTFSKKYFFSGGGYFRFLPYPLIKNLMHKSPYVMTYFHPRDFDAGQPLLKELPIHRKIKSYVGLKGALKKFNALLSDFDFVDLAQAEAEIDWSRAKRVKLN